MKSVMLIRKKYTNKFRKDQPNSFEIFLRVDTSCSTWLLAMHPLFHEKESMSKPKTYLTSLTQRF